MAVPHHITHFSPPRDPAQVVPGLHSLAHSFIHSLIFSSSSFNKKGDLQAPYRAFALAMCRERCQEA